ncbi:Beta-glucosidase 47 [Ancistrocladus abbreviatus]
MKMAPSINQVLLTLILSAFVVSARYLQMPERPGPSDSPTNFLFGTASSSYQYEGAYNSDGKGLGNWDVFSHKAGKIKDESNGDVATDHYHLYQEDVNLMADLGVNSYRFSISWARILPKGRYGIVNWAGIDFYNKLIDALLQKGIEPLVTLCHFDIPQELEDRYGGWLSPKLKEDFGYYANVCFKFFGDRVKYWVTFNEPNVLAINGYRNGVYPPGRCSGLFGNCTEGDSEKEPFLAAHNIILAHVAAVDLYRTKYQREQGGFIGIVLNYVWFEPISNSSADKLAAERAQSFFTNWFLDPIILGNYPAEMRSILGSNLPEFSREEQKKLKRALDFIGVNHYTSFYVKDCIFSKCQSGPGTSRTEGLYQRNPNGILIGEPTTLDWLYVYPQGMENIITYVKERYNNTPMIITENGYVQESTHESSTKELLKDFKRVEYMDGYLKALLRAIREGADVRGYFAWSLLDNFEWEQGYTKRFGLFHVDYDTLERTPKLSAAWYRQFIVKHKAAKKMMPERR